MADCKITLIGLENYYTGATGSSLFEDLILPSGIDKDILVDSILMRCGEFGLVYSDPIFLKASIELWGKRWYRTFERWERTLTEEYNPLHNYDRTEEIDETVKEDNKAKATTTSDSKSHSKSDSEGTQNDTTTGDTSAYNVSTYSPKDQQILDSATTGKVTTDGTSNDSMKSDSNENKDLTRKHRARMFGNIGVTTSATMATEEVELRGKYNLYNIISDVFVKEFCLMVY